jgi:hypothetical protein
MPNCVIFLSWTRQHLTLPLFSSFFSVCFLLTLVVVVVVVVVAGRRSVVVVVVVVVS